MINCDLPDQTAYPYPRDMDKIRLNAKMYFESLCSPDSCANNEDYESIITDAVMSALYGEKWQENADAICKKREENRLENV